ncbi:MAG: TIGR03619 family F420-dependent LLM class oxidoreductase [Dehalococcoidia bacterium]
MSVRIGVGMAAFPFSSPQALWRWVDLCEDGDVDSIWQTDRLVSEQPFLEPLALMAALAARTERLRFGTNVVVMPLRDPLVVAKQCATIDYLSGGRFVPAFGVGADGGGDWGATGRDRRARGARTDEALEIMTRLWDGERVTFEGAHYQYRDASIAPLPVQRPLPLWVGGSSAAAVRRTARLGTGWLAGGQTVQQVTPVVEAVRSASAGAGRPLDADHYGAGFAFRFGSWEDDAVRQGVAGLARYGQDIDPRDYLAVGDIPDVLDRVEAFRAAGISKFVLRPLAVGDADILEQTRHLIEDVLPVVHAG